MRGRAFLSLILLGLLCLGGAADVDATAKMRNLNRQEESDLATLQSLRRAADRKSEQARQSARQVALEIESLRREIIGLSKRQGVSEQRASIYRAKLETLAQREADIVRRLSAERGRVSRLLSALQVWSRNPPPTIFVSTQRANDSVRAAIIIRAVTPELQKRTQKLATENAELVRIRRDAALQNEALFISENDVARQQEEIEALIRQKSALEDQLLRQADHYEAEAVQLAAREKRLRGENPIAVLTGTPDSMTLVAPVVGNKVGGYNQVVDGARSRGVTLSAQPGAQVISPGEGEVEYVGPLDGYGQVIVLNLGNNYRVVITGLGRVYVDKGQSVARNEPLGRMPNLSTSNTLLYMELRQGETPINPDTKISLR